MGGEVESPVREHPEGCVCEVRVKPGSSRSLVEGTASGRIVVSVHSPPREGRANREAVKVLSAFLGVPPSRLVVVRGEASREKSILVRGLSKREALGLLGMR
ncbi:MAG: DUF167 domain-containing protein [Actinobacteria bacterium]|nr:DUF167 domain-containing protein [Actinomycetota bacterium]